MFIKLTDQDTHQPVFVNVDLIANFKWNDSGVFTALINKDGNVFEGVEEEPEQVLALIEAAKPKPLDIDQIVQIGIEDLLDKLDGMIIETIGEQGFVLRRRR